MSRNKKQKTQIASPKGEKKQRPFFSFLLPTRERPDLVARFFDSIVENTSRLNDLEIILAVDDDDVVSKTIEDRRLEIKKIILKKGASMGELNNACYDVSSGRFIMLVNDDLILRTKGWDDKVKTAVDSVEDDICLIHVNELMFQEKLCTFPMLSRSACEAVGLCPRGYERYRIDDHIYDIYSLLAHLGYPRILYLKEVVFEHINHQAEALADDAHFFKAADNKVYRPNQEIIARDAALFLKTLNDRKKAAKDLAVLIEDEKKKKRYAGWLAKLDEAEDSYCYRKPEYYRSFPNVPRRFRTTVAISTANLYSPHAAKCIKAVKDYSTDIDLILMDNHGSKDFSHPRDMNQVLDAANTRYVALLDDDVFVEPGWLDGMLRAMDDQTGVVVPLHKDISGNLSFSGAYIGGDVRGSHAHLLDLPKDKRVIECYCSAIMLVDMEKVGHIRMDRAYEKYYFDIVHGLEIWESGYQAKVTPEVIVTHVGGATAVRDTAVFNAAWQRDGDKFANLWVKTKRLAALEQGIWQQFPELKEIIAHSETIKQVLHLLRFSPISQVSPTLLSLVIAYKDWEGLKPLLGEGMYTVGNSIRDSGDPVRAQYFYSVAMLMQSKSEEIKRQDAVQVKQCKSKVEQFLESPMREATQST